MNNTLNIRVGLTDCTPEGELKLGSLIAKATDVEYFQILQDDVFTQYRKENHVGVVVRYRYFEVIETIKLNDNLTITTYVYNINPLIGYRHTYFYRDLRVVAKIYSEGVFLDLTKNEMVRLPVELVDCLTKYPKQDLEKPLEESVMNLSYHQLDSVVIPRDYIDIYQHVNNAKYITVAQEYIPFKVKNVSMWNRSAAKYHDVIRVYSCEKEDSQYIKLECGADEIICIIRFGKDRNHENREN